MKLVVLYRLASRGQQIILAGNPALAAFMTKSILKRQQLGLFLGLLLLCSCATTPASPSRKGQLPGWSRMDRFPHRVTFHTHSFGFGALDLLKKGDSSIYHYQVTRASEDSPWKLLKAWRADQNDHLVQEYTIP